MCNGCREFHEALGSGKLDEELPVPHQNEEGRQMWMELYAYGFAAATGSMLHAFVLPLIATERCVGPVETFETLAKLGRRHREYMSNTGQSNEKIEAMTEAIAYFEECLRANKEMVTSDVHDDLVGKLPFVSEDQANLN